MTSPTTRPSEHRPPGRWWCHVCGQRGRGGQAAFYEHYDAHLDEPPPRAVEDAVVSEGLL